MSTDQTTEQGSFVDRGPFLGNSIRLAVTKEINVSQLQDEIAARTRAPVQVVLTTDGPEHIASKETPATLYASPASLNEKVVQAVVDSHVARQVGRPPQGVDPASVTTGFNADSLPQEAQALIEKLKDGDTLKTSESSNLLRAILGIEV